jgi:transcriptional regulator with XRE-family HTH domain
MNEQPGPPPEAVLIKELREKPPHMSQREAADQAGISHSHWRQIESGERRYTGIRYVKTAARMARVVGGTPDEFRRIGRGDIAGELEVLLMEIDVGPFTGNQKRTLQNEARRIPRNPRNKKLPGSHVNLR